MILRAEQRALMLIAPGRSYMLIPFERYDFIEQLLNGEHHDGGGDPFMESFETSGFLAWMRKNPELARKEMKRSASICAPENAYAAPTLLNLELTTRCPLRCPQCYCDLQQGKDLPLDRALEVLRQAEENGVADINLSGGETMVYPHIYRLLEECFSLGLHSSVALSGYGVDKSSIQRMVDSGVGEIYISLNGSTEEISRATRDGHHLAIRALELLAESAFKNTAVNWVAHRGNIADFTKVAALCERFGVKRLVVIAFKPDAAHRMESAPDRRQALGLAQDIKRLQKDFPNLRIEVESCYSPLRALLSQKFFVNINTGISKGCGAGRDGVSLNVDGNFTPCRHLDFPEAVRNLRDYWYTSDVLRRLRAVENAPEEPCAQCRYGVYCLSCLAVNAKLHGRIVKADKSCFLWEK